MKQLEQITCSWMGKAVRPMGGCPRRESKIHVAGMRDFFSLLWLAQHRLNVRILEHIDFEISRGFFGRIPPFNGTNNSNGVEIKVFLVTLVQGIHLWKFCVTLVKYVNRCPSKLRLFATQSGRSRLPSFHRCAGRCELRSNHGEPGSSWLGDGHGGTSRCTPGRR